MAVFAQLLLPGVQYGSNCPLQDEIFIVDTVCQFVAEGSCKGVGNSGCVVQCLIGVEELEDLTTYKHEVWLVAGFKLQLYILDTLHRNEKLLHLRVICSPNLPGRYFVSKLSVLDSLLIVTLDADPQLVEAYQHGIRAAPPGFTVIDQ